MGVRRRFFFWQFQSWIVVLLVRTQVQALSFRFLRPGFPIKSQTVRYPLVCGIGGLGIRTAWFGYLGSHPQDLNTSSRHHSKPLFEGSAEPGWPFGSTGNPILFKQTFSPLRSFRPVAPASGCAKQTKRRLSMGQD